MFGLSTRDSGIETLHRIGGIGYGLLALFFGENPQAVAYSAQSLCSSGPPPLTGEQYGKIEPKYPEGFHCQNVLRPQGVINVPFIFNNSLQRHLTWSATHDVVSREIDLWKSFDLLLLWHSRLAPVCLSYITFKNVITTLV